ncbi:MAG TPA: HlyD family efflux transporter periplasmic adaptor subunit [Prolixibacteraceae bacterium]|nr:HlyD family efflux transporter periplasmic adaptor subunit [Prolixibacteraceae bacterium]
MKKLQLIVLILLALGACKSGDQKSDAYGNFEAVETIVSSEMAGKLLSMEVKQGDMLEPGQLIAQIDTTELVLKKLQTKAQLAASETKKQNVTAQINVFKEQKKNVLITQQRIAKMFAEKAATQQQVDDINGQMNVLDKQISATKTQFQLIGSEMDVIKRQLDVFDEQLTKCRIISPISGTILETYLENGELATPGKPVLKMADLSSLELKVYVSGAQLANVKLGNEAKVLIDSGSQEMQTLSGKITWISSESEFTPKIIQTKEERVKLMYGVKILVPNDGSLKIGMPGEVMF